MTKNMWGNLLLFVNQFMLAIMLINLVPVKMK